MTQFYVLRITPWISPNLNSILILFNFLDFNQQNNAGQITNTAQLQQAVNILNRNQQQKSQQVQQITNQQRLQHTKIVAATNAFATPQRNLSELNVTF